MQMICQEKFSELWREKWRRAKCQNFAAKHKEKKEEVKQNFIQRVFLIGDVLFSFTYRANSP